MNATAARTPPVLVVDDDGGFRAFVTATLERAGFEVSEAETGEEALAAAEALAPALVVLDVSLPRTSGYEVCHQLREQLGDELGIVFVSGTRTEELDRISGLLHGADAYLTKPFAPDEMLAHARRFVRPRPTSRAAAGSDRFAELTPRERQVLAFLADGLRQAEIAARLVISPRTVATHIQRVLGKLDVHSRAEAVAYAHRHGLGHDEVNGHAALVTPNDAAAAA